jgi:hypothetical protein
MNNIRMRSAGRVQHRARPAHVRLAAIIALAIAARGIERDIGPVVFVLVYLLLAGMHDAQHPRTGMAMQLDLETFEARVFAHLRFVQYRPPARR